MDDTPMPLARAHVPAFDGLRAIAATAVVLAHCASGRGALATINSIVGPGALGVDLFFALSGFLITGILADLRGDMNPSSGLLRFYARRALRIFPLYYFAVSIYLALGYEGIRENVWWFAFYAVNIGKSLGASGWEPLAHFWTLAVEEQFYIAWPAVVLLVPCRRLGRACIALAIGSLGFRCALAGSGANAFAVTQLTPGCLEPLALGAWFATLDPRDRVRNARRMVWFGLALTLGCMALAAGAQAVLSRAAHALLFAPLLPLLAASSGGRVWGFLCLPPLRFVGTVSYGLYVWHVPVLDGISRWTSFDDWAAGVPRPVGGVVLFAIALPVSIAVASASWFLLERPFLRLKDRFA